MTAANVREDSEAYAILTKVSADLAAPGVAFLCHEDCPVNGETIHSSAGTSRGSSSA